MLRKLARLELKRFASGEKACTSERNSAKFDEPYLTARLDARQRMLSYSDQTTQNVRLWPEANVRSWRELAFKPRVTIS